MHKMRWLSITLLLTTLLAACNAPARIALAPETAALAPLPTEISPLPTQTTLPPISTAVPPTQTVPPGNPLAITQIHMIDTANGWSWVSKEDGSSQLLRSADGGAIWINVTPPQQSITPYNGFYLDAQTAWLPVFDQATSASSLLRTSDGGKTWTTLPTIDSPQNAWYEFSNPNDGVAQVAGVGAGNLYLNMYSTSDGGQSWAPILLTAPSPEPGLPAGTVHLCNICGDGLYYDSTRAVISYGDLANDSAGAVRLAVSTDLGQNWKDLKLPFPDPKYAGGLVGPKPMRFFGPQGLLPVNIIKYGADGALAFSVLALYSTQDGGQSWTAAPALLESTTSQFDSVQIISPLDVFVRCGRNLCATNDGGQTWRTLPDNLNFDMNQGGPDYVTQYNFVSPTSGWALSGDQATAILWKTTDGGESWTKLAPVVLP